jgi:hypothetical protein
MILYLASSQDSVDAWKYLTQLAFRRTPTPNLDSALFRDNIQGVLIQCFEGLRQNAECHNFTLILIIDNCFCYTVQHMLRILSLDKVTAFAFAPRIAHLFQILDLSFLESFSDDSNSKLRDLFRKFCAISNRQPSKKISEIHS